MGEVVDKDKLIALLNEDLELEFQSIVQYTQHLATVKGVEFQPVAEMIRPHLKQELEHATVLAEQIDFLGGIPTTRVPDVPSEPDPKRAFALDLELEERQLVNTGFGVVLGVWRQGDTHQDDALPDGTFDEAQRGTSTRAM